MSGLIFVAFLLCSIIAPSLAYHQGRNSWTDFVDWFEVPRIDFLSPFRFLNKTGVGEIRKVIDLTIGSEALSTKFTSGVSTFSAYSGISTTIVAVVTVVIIAFPFVILLVYLSLVVFFPDPASPVPFERDIAVTMKHLKYIATDVEDRVFDFLEEITDPSKYTQVNQPSHSFSSGYHGGHNAYSQYNLPYQHNQYSDGPLDSYVQYASNQNHYRPLVENIGGQNAHWFNDAQLSSNNVQRQIQAAYYPQNPHSKNLVVQRPLNHFLHPTKQQTHQPQKGYFLSDHDPSKETRRLSYAQPNFYLQNVGNLGGNHGGNLGGNLGHPLRNNAFDPSFNIGPIRSPTMTNEKPLIDQRGQTPQSIELQLKALAQLNSNKINGYHIGSFSSFAKEQKFNPSPASGPIVPRNSLLSNFLVV